MQKSRFFAIAMLIGLSCAATMTAQTTLIYKTTKLTVSQPIQIPGAVLPPGVYTIRLNDSPSNRNIVHFLNEDQSKVYATTIAISNRIPNNETRGDTQLYFYEAADGQPPALRSWLYPGATEGLVFVYPQAEAKLLSERTGRIIPSMDDDAARNLSSGGEARVYSWTPAGREGSQEEMNADNQRRDSDPAWRERQQQYQTYGRFMQEQGSSSGTNANEGASSTNQQQVYTVSRDIVVPANISERRAVIDNVMQRIEQHGDMVKKVLDDSVQISALDEKERSALRRTASQLENTLDRLVKNYKKSDYTAAHEELRSALELGAAINTYMAQPVWGGNAEQAWSAMRNDLNELAAAHTFPVIEVITVQPAQGQRRP